MAFTRRTVAGYGLTDEQLEKVMTLYATSLADYIPKSELQEKITEAVNAAKKDIPAPNIKESEEYKTLKADFDNYKKKIETSSELKKGGVKDKFVDNVYSLLTDEKPIEEQLSAIREQYEEYFDGTSTQQQPNTPQFGTSVQGQMPSGSKSTTFEDVWGLGKK